jgi:steroid delta-isomerase
MRHLAIALAAFGFLGAAQAVAAPPVAPAPANRAPPAPANRATPAPRADVPAPRPPDHPADQVIRATLTGWAADFNAGHADRVCLAFATDLLATYRGSPDRNYQDTCDLLRQSLADEARGYTYDLDIQEILVSGDLAVARLVWRLTTTPHDGAATTTLQEPGMDVLHRQSDGSWKIIRYLGFEAP